MNIPNLDSITIKDHFPKKITLDNNIPVYCFENKDMEVVYMKINFYNAGSVFQDKLCVANLTKSQLSQDTKKYSALDLSEQIDYYGIGMSQLCTNEMTVLNFSFLKKYQTQAIDIIEQMVLYPLFNSDKLDITIQNYKQNLLAKYQQSSFLAQKKLVSNLFGEENPYGKYAAVEDYDKVNTEDLKMFYNKRYTYNQCHIILAGNIDEEFVRLLGNVLGSSTWNKETADTTPNNIIIDKENYAKTIITDLPSAVQTSICMGKKFPTIDNEDFLPLKILNCLLGGYFNSRLMSNIREDKGYTYDISSFILPYTNVSMFLIATDVTKDKDERTIEEIFKEIKSLKEKKVDSTELTTVKNYLIGELLRMSDGVSDIAETYDYILKHNLPENYYSKLIETIKKTDSGDIMRLANKYFAKNDFIISLCKNNNK
jgi:zinc protease